MTTQHEILSPVPLLDENGNLTEPGYAKKLLPVYRRSDIRASALRIKEWDYYLVNNGRFALALTVADNGYMGMDSISLLDFTEGWEITTSPMSVLPMGKIRMPETSAKGTVDRRAKGLSESMVICTPFPKNAHFYYNQKINCMRASGTVTYGGRTWTFDPADSFACLDWGRGVWTYHNTWYWGSASYQVDGVPFGWNIGYGFGDCSAASENMLFYNGKAHKLSQVTFHIPGDEKDFLSPWTFDSDDGRFQMDFTPVMDRASCTDFGILKSDQHQVFGTFTGTAVLDDGTEIHVRDLPGFAEKVENKW